MSCDLTAGYTKPCRNEKGGVKSLIFIEVANKATFNVTAGEIDTFTLNTGKQGCDIL